MRFEFVPRARDELERWKADPKAVERIRTLLRAIAADPFRGVGKPEPLRFELRGAWSRRIDRKHRLIYRIEGDVCYVLKCRGHYDDK